MGSQRDLSQCVMARRLGGGVGVGGGAHASPIMGDLIILHRLTYTNPCQYFSRVVSCFFVTTHTFSFVF